MDPGLDSALSHRIVGKHRAVAHLAGERERLERAALKHQQRSREHEEHQGRVAAWRRACDQAVAEGQDMPPPPKPPDYDISRAANVIHQQRQQLVEQAHQALADAADDGLVEQLADEADRLLAATAKGRVADLPKQLAVMNQLRTVITTVAGCRWPQVRPEARGQARVTGEFGAKSGDRPYTGLFPRLDMAGLVALTVGPKDPHSQTWQGFLHAERRRDEAAAAEAARLAALSQRAQSQPGRMVAEGLGRNDTVVPVEDNRLAGRR